jgi:cytochrome c oxidase cbb3-type subunit 2
LKPATSLMIVLILLVLVVGGLVEIVPLFFQKSTTEPIKGVQPYTAFNWLAATSTSREGCYNCHSQMIRPFRAETCVTATIRWRVSRFTTIRFNGVASAPDPILAPRGWQVQRRLASHHLNNPRDVVPESNMPAYPVVAQEIWWMQPQCRPT